MFKRAQGERNMTDAEVRDAIIAHLTANPGKDIHFKTLGTDYEQVVRAALVEPAPAVVEYRCPKCGAAADERWDCCEVHAMTAPAVAVPEDIEELIERLLDAQQDINLAANTHMSQALCDASALIDEVETALRMLAAAPQPPVDTNLIAKYATSYEMALANESAKQSVYEEVAERFEQEAVACEQLRDSAPDYVHRSYWNNQAHHQRLHAEAVRKLLPSNDKAFAESS